MSTNLDISFRAHYRMALVHEDPFSSLVPLPIKLDQPLEEFVVCWLEYPNHKDNLVCVASLQDLASHGADNLLEMIAAWHARKLAVSGSSLEKYLPTRQTLVHYIEQYPPDRLLTAESTGPVAHIVAVSTRALLAIGGAKRTAALKCSYLFTIAEPIDEPSELWRLAKQIPEITRLEWAVKRNRRGYWFSRPVAMPFLDDPKWKPAYIGSPEFIKNRRPLQLILMRLLPRDMAWYVFWLTVEAERRELLVVPYPAEARPSTRESMQGK